MATINTLRKQGKLEPKRKVNVIEIPHRALETKEVNVGKGGVRVVITKLAPIQFKGGRLKGSKELIKMRKQVQRYREGSTVVC